MAAPPALAVPPGLDSCRALLEYDAAIRRWVVGLKNRDERALVTPLAEQLATLVPHEPGLVVTWAPTSPRRTRQRGYDQAELLARAVGRRLGLPVRRLLVRRAGAAQSGRAAGDRWHHPGFSALRLIPTAVVVIDDVATTGATLSAAARALRGAGAHSVHGLVVARAPAPTRRAARPGEV